MKICTVCIMVFNEVESLSRVIKGFVDISQDVENSLSVALRILIIDDGSLDGSGETAERLAEEHDIVSVVHHSQNKGLGEVYRTGFKAAVGDYVTFYPADGQFDPMLIFKYLPLMKRADLVLGYSEDGRVGLLGHFLSLVERCAYKALFGHFPNFQGIMMFRRNILDEIPILSRGRGWGNVMELILRAHRQGYKIAHVPICIRPRLHGKSKVNNWRSIWANMEQLIELRFKLRKRSGPNIRKG